jgi:purine-nucleoside/S-methyl-5'-thioadenosine phosphorylase / adenosine deaminase
VTTEALRRLTPHGEPPRYFTFPALAAAGLPHASTTRHCPDLTSPSEPTSPFTPGACEALAAAGVDLERAAYARQVHGADVARDVTRGGAASAADVLSTAAPGVPLAIFSADCLAITLWDAEAGALALAHVGWRGTAKRAQQAALDAVTALGARAARLRVAIAPSIGPCCYEVGEPVIGEFMRAFGAARWERWTRPTSNGRAMLDLWTANEELLKEAGVDPRRIENPRLCTACHPALLYSYRKGNRGRLVTVAALP